MKSLFSILILGFAAVSFSSTLATANAGPRLPEVMYFRLGLGTAKCTGKKECTIPNLKGRIVKVTVKPGRGRPDSKEPPFRGGEISGTRKLRNGVEFHYSLSVKQYDGADRPFIVLNAGRDDERCWATSISAGSVPAIAETDLQLIQPCNDDYFIQATLEAVPAGKARAELAAEARDAR